MNILDKPTKVSEIESLTEAQKAELIAIAGDFVTRRGDYEYLLSAAHDDAATIAEMEAAPADAKPMHYNDIPLPK